MGILDDARAALEHDLQAQAAAEAALRNKPALQAEYTLDADAAQAVRDAAKAHIQRGIPAEAILKVRKQSEKVPGKRHRAETTTIWETAKTVGAGWSLSGGSELAITTDGRLVPLQGRVRFKDGRDRDVRQNSTRMGMDQLPSTVTITIRKGYGNGSTFSLILGEAETTVVGLDTPLHVYTIYDRSGYDENTNVVEPLHDALVGHLKRIIR